MLSTWSSELCELVVLSFQNEIEWNWSEIEYVM